MNLKTIKTMKTKTHSLRVFALFLFISSSLYSQNSEFAWATYMGGTGRDSGNSITTDAQGNVYTTGYFEGTADFDPSTETLELTSAGFYDIFIQKLDPDGQLIWVKQIGNTGKDEAYSITIDPLGNVYTTGVFAGIVDFDPGTDTHYLTGADNLFDIFVLKLDGDGNFIWAKQFGDTGLDQGNSIAIDPNGDVLVAGIFSGTVDFDPGDDTAYLTEIGTVYDMFILKLDADGNFIWVKQIGGIKGQLPTAIDTDQNGNIYTTGYFNDSADFNPGSEIVNLTSFGSTDIFVLKLDTDGNFIWVKQMGGANIDHGNSLTIDLNGDIYSTGYFRGTSDFDPSADVLNFTSASADSYDFYIHKLDTNGNLLWVKHLGGTSGEWANSITTDANGNVYTLGNFGGTMDFDPGEETYELTSGSFDTFILKLSGNGDFIWVTQNIGNYGVDSKGNSITVDANENVYSTGYFVQIVDFDPGDGVFELSTVGGYWDAFIQKLGYNPLGIAENTLLDNFVVHPNPTNGKFSVEFQKYQESVSVKLFSLTGQLLFDKQFQNSKTLQLELEQSAGIYLLELIDSDNNKAKIRIIKR